jgi:hypothetical protein
MFSTPKVLQAGATKVARVLNSTDGTTDDILYFYEDDGDVVAVCDSPDRQSWCSPPGVVHAAPVRHTICPSVPLYSQLALPTISLLWKHSRLALRNNICLTTSENVAFKRSRMASELPLVTIVITNKVNELNLAYVIYYILKRMQCWFSPGFRLCTSGILIWLLTPWYSTSM